MWSYSIVEVDESFQVPLSFFTVFEFGLFMPEFHYGPNYPFSFTVCLGTCYTGEFLADVVVLADSDKFMGFKPFKLFAIVRVSVFDGVGIPSPSALKMKLMIPGFCPDRCQHIVHERSHQWQQTNTHGNLLPSLQ